LYINDSKGPGRAQKAQERDAVATKEPPASASAPALALALASASASAPALVAATKHIAYLVVAIKYPVLTIKSAEVDFE